MVNVLFVCLGNICRSPMAEAVFKYKVEQQGLKEQIFVDSAGTGSWHVGHPPHEGTQAILKSKGISYVGIKSRKLMPGDMRQFDYIIAMDQSNVKSILKYSHLSEERRVQRLLDFVPERSLHDVPDPYYTGDFEEVYALVDAGTDALLAYILEKHQQLGVKQI